MGRTVLFKALIIAFLLFIPKTALSDDLSELKSQMQKMQKENKVLEEQLAKQREATERLLEKIKALESKDEVLPKDAQSLEEKPMGPFLHKNAELPAFIDIPKLKINGFADLGFSAKITNKEDSNTFGLGAMDLFITSEVAEKVSFLAEPVFEFDTETNQGEFDLERAHLKYSLSGLFNIMIGRMHTPLGYWNQAYHHGTWLQTTVFRPEIYRFEDDNGILPVHSVGIELSGAKAFDAFDLGYHFDIVNGRGRTRTEVQNIRDTNKSKAINVLLSLKPHFTEGLQLGVDVYIDTIPPDPGDPARTNQIDERIVGGYVTYIRDRAELFGEISHIHHNDKTSGNDFGTLGAYLQGGYRIDKFTPYYRFDYINFGNGDPYFATIANDLSKHTLGLRWDILTWNALKFEYSFSDLKGREDEHSLTVNASFAF